MKAAILIPAWMAAAVWLPPPPLRSTTRSNSTSSAPATTACTAGCIRAGIVPAPDGRSPAVVLTLQTLWLKGSDVFGPLNEMRTDDLGRTWSGPREHAATLGQRREPDGVTVGACDFWPKWHAASGRLLGIGHTVRVPRRRRHPRPGARNAFLGL